MHFAGDFVQRIEKDLRLKGQQGAKLLVGEDVMAMAVVRQKVVMNSPEDPERP